MKLHSTFCALLFTFAALHPSFGQSDKRLKGVDKDLNSILEATKAPGFAVAVVQGDQVIYARGFGYRDYENKVPMDANTLLAIGSCSKAFTSAIMGQLRDKELLSFDDSPIDHIPELRFFNETLNAQVNIRDLMSHQTGIPRHDFSWYLFPTFNRDSLIMRIKHQEPFTGLRQKWNYNNFMFLVQGVIAERISGKSWEDNIRERFFVPLGMDRSNVSIAELEQSENAALGYELHNKTEVRKMDYYKIAAMAPAGSINSSVNDMAKWLIVWLNKGKYQDEQILPEIYVNEAMSSQAVIGAGLPDPPFDDMFLANYGYGWMISSYRGHYRVEHGGNIDGFSASTSFFPSDDLGIVVLANQNGSAVPSLVRNTIADRMLQSERTNWAEHFASENVTLNIPEEPDTTAQRPVAPPSHPLEDYLGNYGHPGYGDFEVASNADSLFAIFPLKKFYLKHLYYDVFEPFEVTKYGIDTTDTSPIKFNFTTGITGEIRTVTSQIEPALQDPISFKRQPKYIQVKLAELEPYAGEYMIAGTAIKVYTKADESLYMFVPGQPEYKLTPTGENTFGISNLEGYSARFEKDTNGDVKEIVLIQPNGTFRAQKQ